VYGSTGPGVQPDNPDYPWSFTLYGDKGTLLASTMRYDFTPVEKDAPKIHKDVVYEKEKYPEDLTEERIELNAAPCNSITHARFPGGD
jgi:hypothetical protein